LDGLKGKGIMSGEFLPDPKYKFVAGHGDVEHERRLAEAVDEGYRVKLVTHNPDGAAGGKELVVLMEKEGEKKKGDGR
jgi:hypothetical protein